MLCLLDMEGKNCGKGEMLVTSTSSLYHHNVFKWSGLYGGDLTAGTCTQEQPLEQLWT